MPPSLALIHTVLLSDYVFAVEITGLGPVGYFTYCSGLEVEVEVLTYAEGGNDDMIHQLPGRVHFPNLTLTAGMTKEKTLAEWFKDTRNSDAKPKEVSVTLYVSGKPDQSRKWTFKDAFPVKWRGPTPSASNNGIATETIEIAHGGLAEAS